MPGSGRIVLVLAGLVLVTTGCRSHEEVHARYTLERLSWKAQVQERKINIAFIKASQKDLALAIERLNDVVAYDPLSQYNTSDWDPQVVSDIRRIRLASRIALASLYFLSEQYQEAGDFYQRTLKDATIDFKKQLSVRLNLVRTVYLTGDTDLLEQQCAAIFEEIDQSEDFWAGTFALQDVFLGIPLVLTRLYAERENWEKYGEFSSTAEQFYTRVAQTWPDDMIAAKAVYSRVMIFLQREEWNNALSDIEQLMDNDHFKPQRGQLLLLKGEILAYALDDIPAGESVFNRLMDTHSGTSAGYAAQYNVASLKLKDGEEREGFELLRELEGGDRVPAEVAARAMMTRALYLEKEDRWDEALPLFRRLMRLFPNTEPAVEAPLVVTRHYLRTGETQLAKRNLTRDTEFYASLLERQSKYRGDRLLVEDFLIENYLAMNRGREIADLLETRSREWDEISSAGAYLKSAVIYSAVLEDDENATRVLKKSIELFPQTRYAKIAQQQLDRIEEGGGD
jgi:tetratricopeptide (TPR) repeat protein